MLMSWSLFPPVVVGMDRHPPYCGDAAGWMFAGMSFLLTVAAGDSTTRLRATPRLLVRRAIQSLLSR
jgi:hypothetical protein